MENNNYRYVQIDALEKIRHNKWNEVTLLIQIPEIWGGINCRCEDNVFFTVRKEGQVFSFEVLYMHYCGQKSLRRNSVAIMVNKRVQNAVLGRNIKNNRMISVHFQGKPFNITVIQVYAPTSNAKEAEVEQFYEDLKHLVELTAKICPLHYRGLEWKSRKSRNTWSNRKICSWSTKQSRSKDKRVLPREHTGHSKHPLPTT